MDWGRLGELREDWEGLGKIDYACRGPGEGWEALTLHVLRSACQSVWIWGNTLAQTAVPPTGLGIFQWL